MFMPNISIRDIIHDNIEMEKFYLNLFFDCKQSENGRTIRKRRNGETAEGTRI